MTETRARSSARIDSYPAAPFDAMAYNGMQLNGGVDVSQEIAGNGLTLSSGAAAAYIADGVKASFFSGTAHVSAAQAPTVNMGSPPLGGAFPFCAFMWAPTAFPAFASMVDGDFAAFTFPIEGWRTARLAWGTANAQPLSIAMQLWSGYSSTLLLRVSNAGDDRNYYYELPVVFGWNYKTLTIPGDQTNGAASWTQTTGVGLQIRVYAAGKNTTPAATVGGVSGWIAASKVQSTNSRSILSNTANDAMVVTGLFVVPGIDLPSQLHLPFVVRPFDQELKLCQRYYDKSYNYGVLPGAASSPGACFTVLGTNSLPVPTMLGSFPYNAQKRVVPIQANFKIYSYLGTLGQISNGDGTADLGPAAVSNIGDQRFLIYYNGISATTTNFNEISFHWVCDVRL